MNPPVWLKLRRVLCRRCDRPCPQQNSETLADPTAFCPIWAWQSFTHDMGPVPRSARDDFRAGDPQSRDEARLTQFRALWSELHKRTLAYQGDQPAEREYLDAFARRLPCGDCRRHWAQITAKLPPDLESPGTYFAWSVAAHNEVNRSKATPSTVLSLTQAAVIWCPAGILPA